MFYLKSVAISVRIDLWTSEPFFKKISIIETKSMRLETQSGGEIKSFLGCFPSFKWLRFDVYVRGN